jgi:hypothetical protein
VDARVKPAHDDGGCGIRRAHMSFRITRCGALIRNLGLPLYFSYTLILDRHPIFVYEKKHTKITYDINKAVATFETRGISFDDAVAVFAGDTITLEDSRVEYGKTAIRPSAC